MQIAFIGYGELGRQIHTFILQSGLEMEAFFFDDDQFRQGQTNAFPFAEYESDIYKNCSFIIALGYKHLPVKQGIIQRLAVLKRNMFSFFHSSAFVNPTSIIEKGTVVYPLCNIDKEVKISAGVLLNNSVIVSHNSQIGESSYISPGVTISGNVIIGQNVFIGAGATVANGVKIGNNVIIGIGTVVTADIPENSFAIGNPMRFVKNLTLV